MVNDVDEIVSKSLDQLMDTIHASDSVGNVLGKKQKAKTIRLARS